MQGHHQLDCMDLYSKDDVTPALRLQLLILERILFGWRPTLAQPRGAGEPLVEEPCSVKLAPFVSPEYAFLFPQQVASPRDQSRKRRNTSTEREVSPSVESVAEEGDPLFPRGVPRSA